MAENSPLSSDNAAEQPAQLDEHAARRAARAERRAQRGMGGSMPWISGAILILLGVFLLAQNMNLFKLGNWNWWALFILIPAAGSFDAAWRQYRATGEWNGRALGMLIGGIILTLIACAFLFNLNWGPFWPLLLILAGIAALLAAVRK